MADLLDCTVMPYAWGSRTAIATLQGRTTPSHGPEAELWMGAHPLAPSRIVRGGAITPLTSVIAEDSVRELGAATAARFGPRLPFLLKVLAAEQPLSLQAHPTEAQARAGFDDEERRGVPRDAAHRNYKDPHHKPELVCALTVFDALCGFRRAADTLMLVEALAVPALSAHLAPLRRAPNASGLASAFRAIMTMEAADAARVVEDTVSTCRAYRGPFARECEWAVRLAHQYPGDRGVISALLLNLVRLQPGEAIYLDAGNLHAYLSGVGVEIMASSDNVLRGGLTPKHVDVGELLKVLDFTDGPVPVRHPRAASPNEDVWETPAAEFRLSRIRLDGRPFACAVDGPEIVLCVDGRAEVAPGDGMPAVNLARGQAAFVPASTGNYVLRGTGVVFRATTNIPQ
jgi:mannose-6-phosphate isomerase